MRGTVCDNYLIAGRFRLLVLVFPVFMEIIPVRPNENVLVLLVDWTDCRIVESLRFKKNTNSL